MHVVTKWLRVEKSEKCIHCFFHADTW